MEHKGQLRVHNARLANSLMHFVSGPSRSDPRDLLNAANPPPSVAIMVASHWVSVCVNYPASYP